MTEQRNINQTLNARNRTLEMQIVRLEEENKVQTNAIHQEEQNRKLVEMMSYLEQTFRGVILQLCRLLVLVHKTDPGASIPSDALGLMEWTHQMIEDKQLDVEPAEDSLETNPVNRISYIDVPPRFHSNPYDTRYKETQSLCYLNKRNSQLNMSYLSNTSYISSVSAPVDMDNSHSNHMLIS